MTKRYLMLPAMFFLIPFVYLSLLLDAYYHSTIGFFLSLLLAMVVGFYFQASHQLKIWVVGNILSTVMSLVLQSNHPEWSFFYQPFNPALLVLLLSILYLVPQIIGIVWASFLHISLGAQTKE